MSLHGLVRAAALPLLATLSPLWLVACGQLTSKGALGDPDSGVARKLGCIQGMVVDGLTGKTIDLPGFDAAKGQGLRVVVGDATLAPDATNQAALAARDLSGHYVVCNIPLDEAYPVVVSVPGYQRIEGVVGVASTVASRSPEATNDVAKLVPMATVNIRLYPVGVQTSDLKFVVTRGGLPQKDAHVFLAPVGANTLDGAPDAAAELPVEAAPVDEERFLIPSNISGTPLTMTTDEQGAAIFAAKDLVLGAKMRYRVIPGTTDLKETVATGTLHVGLLALTAVQHPYLMYVDLKNPLPPLAPQSSNLDDNDFVESGELIVYYSREIEQVPGTKDDVVARLIDDNGAELQPEIPGNDKADAVAVVVDGNMLRLTPNWSVKPDRLTEGGLRIVYSGLSIRPKTSPGTADAQTITGREVKIFGAVTPPQIPTTLAFASDSGNMQAASANADLAAPVGVRLLDQFGKPYKKAPYEVVFRVVAGNGRVRAAGSLALGEPSVRVMTDATGQAKAAWRLGNVNGAQTLSVAALGIKPVVFTANAAAVLSRLNPVRGTAQAAPANADAPEPVEFQVVDQNGEAYKAAVTVTFAVDPAAGGLVRPVGAPFGTGQPSLNVTTNADGKAAALWTLGNRTGAQQLKVTAAAFTGQATATAGAVLKSLQKTSGDGLRIGPNTDGVDMEIQLKDQQQLTFPVAGKVVTFQVISGTGTLRAFGTAGPGTATLQTAQTGSDGRAKVTFRLGANSVGTIFQVRASVEGLTPETFTGEVTAKASALEKSGDGQPATLNTDLAPLTVQLKDQDGTVLRLPNVEITFTLAAANGVVGVLRRPEAATGSAATLAVITDATGKASVVAKITAGAGGVDYKVTAAANPVSAPGVQTVEFTGKIQ